MNFISIEKISLDLHKCQRNQKEYHNHKYQYQIDHTL